MKGFIRFTHLSVWLILFLPLALAAQTADTYRNYVVIGAFAQVKNAVHFTDDARKNHFKAQFEMNPNRNLYYVYVLTTPDREYAMAEALKLRTETKYFDTWVYIGGFGAEALKATQAGLHQDLDPTTGTAMKTVVSEQKQNSHRATDASVHQNTVEGLNAQASREKAWLTYAASLTNAQAEHPTQQSSGLVSDATSEDVKRAAEPRRVSTQPLTSEEVTGKDFYFHLFRADNRQFVEGEVIAVDFEKSRKMATYGANASVKVIMPSGKSKQISFICQVFGYRKQQREFDPNAPAEDFYLDEKSNLVIPFELVRLQKGDIAIMYNVFFFKDAAVMRPESRYEVNNLLELLNENPSYKIRIHGHTNGNASGKIIRMDTPGNFYSLAGTKEGFGSAKKLSEERAAVMREFLINSGVSGDRMQIKAWGGKKPIHDKHSARANENVRVEIEILSE